MTLLSIAMWIFALFIPFLVFSYMHSAIAWTYTWNTVNAVPIATARAAWTYEANPHFTFLWPIIEQQDCSRSSFGLITYTFVTPYGVFCSSYWSTFILAWHLTVNPIRASGTSIIWSPTEWSCFWFVFQYQSCHTRHCSLLTCKCNCNRPNSASNAGVWQVLGVLCFMYFQSLAIR